MVALDGIERHIIDIEGWIGKDVIKFFETAKGVFVIRNALLDLAT